MTIYNIRLSLEEEKKLKQILKRLKEQDIKSYLLKAMERDWLNKV